MVKSVNSKLPWPYRSILGRYLTLTLLFCVVFLVLSISMSIWIYEGPKRLISKAKANMGALWKGSS